MKFLHKRAILAVLFLILPGAVCSAFINSRHATIHEVAPDLRAVIGENNKIEIQMEGCFLRGNDGDTLCLKANSLTPRAVFILKSDQSTTLNVTMENISPDSLTVNGANIVASIPQEKKMVVEVSISPAKSTTVEWRLAHVNKEFSFFVFGDNRNVYDVLEKIRRDIARERPLFVVNVGDLTSDGSKEQMLRHEEFAKSVAVPYFTVLGNHDLEKGDKSAANYCEIFGPTFYSFWYGSYFFSTIDNANGYMSLSELRWLNGELKHSQGANERVVFAHQPPFDPREGCHHCMKPLFSGVYLLEFLLGRDAVDYFIAGHIHTYYECKKGPIRYVITGETGHSGVEPAPFQHYVVFKVNGNEVEHFLRPVGEGKSELK